MDSNNTISSDFKKGYIRALVDVFHVLMDNMDDEVQEELFKKLKIQKV